MEDRDYRVIMHKTRVRTWYCIHAVSYDLATGKPAVCSVFPINLDADTVEEIDKKLKEVRKALKKPILNYNKDF